MDKASGGDILRGWVKGALTIGGGLAGAVLLYGGVSLILPPVVPKAAAGQADTVSTVRSRGSHRLRRENSPKSVPAIAPVGADGLVKMAYAGSVWQNALARAKTLGIHMLLPTSAYPHTVLEESYIEGSVLDLEFSDMLAVESNTPISPTYKPASSVNVSLADGVPAQWLLIYGLGGPAYRLDFQQDGTYVRLQLFHSYIPASAAANEAIASEFSPVS